ncbi:MAG: helix-turn-helix transcriptional regulator [Acidimicrobiia bacterium]|nr:helix-turn-helix transcriptional regulator [Acidimicrobiia bacterium]
MRDELGLAIGAKVKALRAERGLSGRKLAAAAGVSQPFLSQLEAGRTSVAIATL